MDSSVIGSAAKGLSAWYSSLASPIFYIVLGVFMAFAVKQGLSYALSSDMPVVAVLSQSMQHDDASHTHYGWLEDTYGYSEEYIDSWPVPTGFLVGDMPVIEGSGVYKVGDVIVYSISCDDYPMYSCDIPIIHRIIKINDDGTYQTKGDNNLHQLPYEFSVPEGQIHGKVVTVIPKVGYFKVTMTNLFGMM